MKTPQNCGLRVMSCVDTAEPQMHLQQKKPREIQNNTSRELRGYNNNGNKSEPSLYTVQQQHQRHRQSPLTLRANSQHHNSHQLNQQQYFWEQTPVQIQQQYLIDDRRKSDFSPTIRSSESALRR